MSKWLSFAITSVMLVLLLAACGGGDDEDDPTATTAASATSAAPATATSATGGEEAESTPTVAVPAATMTPTTAATAPSRPIVTATATPAPATATTTGGADEASELEARMLATLLQIEDFSSDWVQETFEVTEVSTDEDAGICATPPFPDRALRVAGVEARYELNTDAPAYILQNIVLFPEDTAVAAMAYARDASTCTEWTADSGDVYTLLPVSGPDFGDENLVIGMTFTSNGTPLYTEYSFVRVGGAIATIAFITIEGADAAPLRDLTALAAQRLELSGLGQGSTTGTLADAVLVAEDIALIDTVNQWEDAGDLDASDPDRHAYCGAESFPDVFGALQEIGRSIDATGGEGPFAMHTIVEFSAGDGTAVMEWLRTELSCESWSDDDGEYFVAEVGDLDVGDDTFWILVDVPGSAGSTDSSQVGLGFSQVGDYISLVGLAAVDSIDLRMFGALIALGTEKVTVLAP